MTATRRTGQIIRKGPEKWQLRVYLGESANGQRKYVSQTVKGRKRQAELRLQDLLRQNDLGVLGDASRQTLNEYLDFWLMSIAKSRVSERTHTDYCDLMRRYVRGVIGKVLLGDLRATQIQKLYADMQTKGLSARVVRYTHSILNSALKKAVELDLLERNVAKFVTLPKQERRELNVLTADDTRRLLQSLASERLSTLFSFAIATGMRPQEYCGLQWECVDLERAVVSIKRAIVWSRKGAGWTFAEPKTSKSRRLIPLPKTLVDELKIHKKQRLEERMRLGPAWQDHDLVFPSEIGTPLHPRNITRVLKRNLRQAGIEKPIRLYDLRHTSATLLLEAGINPKVVSERLGHATITLTLDVYSHVLPHMQEKASDELEAVMYGKTGTI
jgi:integrase